MERTDLIAWRRQRGLTQQQLAEALGVHTMTLVKWERNQRPMPGAWLDLALEALDARRAAAGTDRPGNA